MSARVKPAQTNRGRFRPGPDPRRHKFTRDECIEGFWAAIESIASRHPNAVRRDGRHIVTTFLPAMLARKARS
ncbi:MAG TPA: hypothetical protein VFQ92_08860 [Blastocatellia bacterium]|nr:hypothetical protein [Blastocatellia bacterium]